ncbi:hypothetical protein FQR65_LT12349 [Abscondita terminalis]|nr:hypothetical protein FQR65_LT12349 [Abscondita terminalis]
MLRATILWTFFYLCCSKELPSYIEKCVYTNDPDLAECIKDRIKVLMPKLENGIPELKLPRLDPFSIPEMEVNTGSGSNVAFQAVLRDLKILGCKNATVEQFQLNLKTQPSVFHLLVPNLSVIGSYEIKGKILLFDLQAKGTFSANLTDVDATTIFEVKVVEKNSKKYIQIPTDNVTVSTSFSTAVVNFEKLFEQQELNDQINKVINENVQDLAKEVAPIVHEAAHVVATGFMNPMFSDYSIDELFIIK